MAQQKCSVCGRMFPRSMLGIDDRCPECLYGSPFPDYWGVSKVNDDVEKVEVKKVHHDKGSDWAIVITYKEKNQYGNKIEEDWDYFDSKQEALEELKRLKKKNNWR